MRYNESRPKLGQQRIWCWNTAGITFKVCSKSEPTIAQNLRPTFASMQLTFSIDANEFRSIEMHSSSPNWAWPCTLHTVDLSNARRIFGVIEIKGEHYARKSFLTYLNVNRLTTYLLGGTRKTVCLGSCFLLQSFKVQTFQFFTSLPSHGCWQSFCRKREDTNIKREKKPKDAHSHAYTHPNTFTKKLSCNGKKGSAQ